MKNTVSILVLLVTIGWVQKPAQGADPVPQPQKNKGHLERIELDRCLLFPEVKVEDMERDQKGVDHADVIFYDLVFKEKVTEMVYVFTSAGDLLSQDTQTFNKVKTQHFEISSNEGNEFALFTRVQQFLRARVSVKCL